MQTRTSIVHLPLIGAFILSIVLHGAALYFKVYTPPSPQIESGRTVVRLTLAPAMPAPSVPTPVVEREPERAPLPAPEPIPEAEPPPAAEPEPVPLPAPAPTPLPEPAAPETPATEHLQTPPDAASLPASETETAAAPSIESDGSPIEDKGAITTARATATISPVYPRSSRRRGEEGSVTLRARILASGRTGTITVLQSSGHKRLDEAACKAVRKASFTAATRLGRPIDSETELTFTFKLTHAETR